LEVKVPKQSVFIIGLNVLACRKRFREEWGRTIDVE